MKTTFYFLLFLIINAQTVFSQELIKYNMSSFSLDSQNDTLLITSSQTLNTFNTNQTIFNGYFPVYDYTLKIDDINKTKFNFIIYPNPFNSYININTSIDNTINYTISINNLQGKNIYYSNYSQNYIYLTNIEAGVYFITITTDSGSIITKKIIKY